MEHTHEKNIYSPEFIPFYVKETAELKLSPLEGLAYGFIRFYAKNNSFFFSSKDFGTILGANEGTINNIISKLTRIGVIITKTKRFSKNGSIHSIREISLNKHFLFSSNNDNSISSYNEDSISSNNENTISSYNEIKDNIKENTKDNIKENTQILEKIKELYPERNNTITMFFRKLLDSDIIMKENIDEEFIIKIRKKIDELLNIRIDLSLEQFDMELIKFIDWHSENKTEFKSTIGRLNTWLTKK